jgi:hypothetical protein
VPDVHEPSVGAAQRKPALPMLSRIPAFCFKSVQRRPAARGIPEQFFFAQVIDAIGTTSFLGASARRTWFETLSGRRSLRFKAERSDHAERYSRDTRAALTTLSGKSAMNLSTMRAATNALVGERGEPAVDLVLGLAACWTFSLASG